MVEVEVIVAKFYFREQDRPDINTETEATDGRTVGRYRRSY